MIRIGANYNYGKLNVYISIWKRAYDKTTCKLIIILC